MSEDFTFYVGLVAGVLTSIAMLPQLIKLIRQKRANDISPWMFITLICGIILWIYYGFRKNDIPIIATNSFAFLINALTLTFSLKYRRKT